MLFKNIKLIIIKTCTVKRFSILKIKQCSDHETYHNEGFSPHHCSNQVIFALWAM